MHERWGLSGLHSVADASWCSGRENELMPSAAAMNRCTYRYLVGVGAVCGVPTPLHLE